MGDFTTLPIFAIEVQGYPACIALAESRMSLNVSVEVSLQLGEMVDSELIDLQLRSAFLGTVDDVEEHWPAYPGELTIELTLGTTVLVNGRHYMPRPCVSFLAHFVLHACYLQKIAFPWRGSIRNSGRTYRMPFNGTLLHQHV